MRGLDRLLELQELDSAIDRLEARKRQLEEGKEMADARAAMEDAEGRLGELRLGVDAVAEVPESRWPAANAPCLAAFVPTSCVVKPCWWVR